MSSAREVIAKEVDPEAFEQGWNDKMLWAEQTADSILSALKDAGWVVVPREPTKAMLEVGCFGYDTDPGATIDGALEAARINYRSMLAAAAKSKEGGDGKPTERDTRTICQSELPGLGVK